MVATAPDPRQQGFVLLRKIGSRPSPTFRSRSRSVTAAAVATAAEPPDPTLYDGRVIDLRTPWRIGPVEVPPTRLVLRWRASLRRCPGARGAATGPASCAPRWSAARGIEHRNERTLGYLRVAADEHHWASSFGSDPRPMADRCAHGRRRRRRPRRPQFRLPGEEGVTRTAQGRTCSRTPDLACRIVEAVADAVDLPVTVKLRRGVRNGSRACLDLGPRSPWTPARSRSRSTPGRRSRCTPGSPTMR